MTFDEYEQLPNKEWWQVTNNGYFQAGFASREAEVEKFKRANLEATRDEIDLLVAESDQLRAQINMLREALEYCVTQVGELATVPGIASALSSTPEQSLAAYRNKVIEAFVNEFTRHVGGDGEFWLHELQDFAMKEQP